MAQPLFPCDAFEFEAISRQPKDFVRKLSRRERAKLAAACQSVGQSFADNRPPAGRTQLIRGTGLSGMFELRVTWPKAPGPQIRLICLRVEDRVLVARAFYKRSRRIPRGEIELAEQALLDHGEGSDEPARKGRG
jgi:phage-related protein